MENIDFSKISRSWAVCSQESCPKHEECLRYAAGIVVSAKKNTHLSVLPSARKDGECTYFVEQKPVSLAWGMRCTFVHVKPWHYSEMRRELEKFFGSHTNYYRYYNGLYAISPQRQKWINDLLKRYGYNKPAKFDKTSIDYAFFTK